jgi:hypothetical protein
MSLLVKVLFSLLACQQCWGAKVVRHEADIKANGDMTISSKTDASELLSSVEKMASGEHVDPDAIKLIKDLVANQLLPALIESHKIASDDIKARLDAIKECEQKSREQDKGVQEDIAKKVHTVRVIHSDCRDKELGLTKDANAKCQFLDFLTEPAAEPKASADKKTKLAYGETMMGYWCNKDEQFKACSAATDALAPVVKECNKKQTQFESEFCAMAIVYHAQCQDLNDVCYTETRAAYDSSVASTSKLIAKWKIEYQALKKINCFLDVWMENGDANTVSSEKLAACKATDADASILNIDFGTPVKEFVCADAGFGTLPDYPGTPEFVTKEYGAWPDLVRDVIHCHIEDPVAVSTTAGPNHPDWEHGEHSDPFANPHHY